MLTRRRVLDLDLERLVVEIALLLRDVDGDKRQIGLWFETRHEGDLLGRYRCR